MAGAVSSYSYKRKLLLSQMLLMTAAAAFVHTLLDAYQLQFKILPINVSVVGWLLILYRLNNKGYHNFARYTSVISVSLILLVLGGMTPEENGLHLLYLPLMCVGFIIFDHDQYWSKISICLFIFACYLVLEFTSFRPLESLPMLEEKERASFVTNFITSGVLLFLVLSYIARANHKAEQHLQQMAMEMQAQNQQLSKANEELDRFVYSTSHDLRAPLLSILGLVQLLETNPQQEPLPPFLHMMRNRINKLTDFINEITDYSRNSRLPVQQEPLQLDLLVQEVFDNHRYLYHDRSIDLKQEISFSEKLPLDRHRMLTILNNLVSNGIKYHRLTHPHPHITVKASLNSNELHLYVSDNGPGIVPEVQARMFDMFYRGDERSEGSGLGLYIVKEAVSKLGGSIKVETEVGYGSTFHICIPVKKLEPESLSPDYAAMQQS